MSETKFQPASADSLARAHTAEAVGTIVSVLRDKFAKPAEKLRAAELLLDRGHGKAAQAVIAVPVRQAVANRLAAMDESALLAIAAAARIGNKDYSRDAIPGTNPALPNPFDMKPDDVTEGEWQEANPPREPDYDEPAAEAGEFPARPNLPPDPWS